MRGCLLIRLEALPQRMIDGWVAFHVQTGARLLLEGELSRVVGSPAVTTKHHHALTSYVNMVHTNSARYWLLHATAPGV